MTDDQKPDDILNLPLFNRTSGGTNVPAPTGQPAAPRNGAAQHLLAAVGQPAVPYTSAPITAPTPVISADSFGQPRRIDWAVVDLLRKQVSDALTASILNRPGLSEADQKELARKHISEIIRDYVDGLVSEDGDNSSWNSEMQHAMAKAVLDSLFGLGRLQPLVDIEDVENIDIYGYDNVFVEHADGTYEQMPPIADSDEDLIREIQFLASRGGEAARSFSAAMPDLDLDLPGGARLAATHPPISPRPKIVIRIHRFIDISMAQMVTERATLTTPMASLLVAAVRSGLSIVVSGHPGAGKTTITRALCNVLDPMVPIVTIEKERELHLDRMPDRHKIVTPLQYRPGQGERGADGSMPGEVSLVQLLEKALRLNAERIVVGEVRGSEIDAMFQAMQSGVGSFSTIHAESATNAIERMATLTTKNMGVTDTYAYRQISQHIRLIVQISKMRDADGVIRRKVTEIAEIEPGEERPIAKPLFILDRVSGEQIPQNQPTPQLLERLVRAGLNPEIFRPGREAA
jgi:Flp pilus assembly CpaF family ATPase